MSSSPDRASKPGHGNQSPFTARERYCHVPAVVHSRLVSRPFVDGRHSYVALGSAAGMSELQRRFVLSLRRTHDLEPHSGCVNSIEFSDKGDWLVTGSDDTYINVYNTQNWDIQGSIKTCHGANIFSAQFIPGSDSRQVVSCGLDGRIALTDLAADRSSLLESISLLSTNYIASKVAFTPAFPRTAFVTHGNGTLSRIDLREKIVGTPASDYDRDTAHSQYSLDRSKIKSINSFSFGTRLPYTFAVGTERPYVFLCDMRMVGQRSCVHTAVLPTGNHNIASSAGVSGLSFSSCGTILAASHKSHDVFSMDLTTLNSLPSRDEESLTEIVLDGMKAERVDAVRYQGRQNSATMFKEVTFYGDDEYVVTGADCGSVFIWERATGRLMRRMAGDEDIVNGVLTHPNLSNIICCGIDSCAKVFSVEATEQVTADEFRPRRRQRRYPWQQVFGMDSSDEEGEEVDEENADSSTSTAELAERWGLEADDSDDTDNDDDHDDANPELDEEVDIQDPARSHARVARMLAPFAEVGEIDSGRIQELIDLLTAQGELPDIRDAESSDDEEEEDDDEEGAHKSDSDDEEEDEEVLLSRSEFMELYNMADVGDDVESLTQKCAVQSRMVKHLAAAIARKSQQLRTSDSMYRMLSLVCKRIEQLDIDVDMGARDGFMSISGSEVDSEESTGLLTGRSSSGTSSANDEPVAEVANQVQRYQRMLESAAQKYEPGSDEEDVPASCAFRAINVRGLATTKGPRTWRSAFVDVDPNTATRTVGLRMLVFLCNRLNQWLSRQMALCRTEGVFSLKVTCPHGAVSSQLRRSSTILRVFSLLNNFCITLLADKQCLLEQMDDDEDDDDSSSDDSSDGGVDADRKNLLCSQYVEVLVPALRRGMLLSFQAGQMERTRDYCHHLLELAARFNRLAAGQGSAEEEEEEEEEQQQQQQQQRQPFIDTLVAKFFLHRVLEQQQQQQAVSEPNIPSLRSSSGTGSAHVDPTVGSATMSKQTLARAMRRSRKEIAELLSTRVEESSQPEGATAARERGTRRKQQRPPVVQKREDKKKGKRAAKRERGSTPPRSRTSGPPDQSNSDVRRRQRLHGTRKTRNAIRRYMSDHAPTVDLEDSDWVAEERASMVEFNSHEDQSVDEELLEELF